MHWSCIDPALCVSCVKPSSLVVVAAYAFTFTLQYVYCITATACSARSDDKTGRPIQYVQIIWCRWIRVLALSVDAQSVHESVWHVRASRAYCLRCGGHLSVIKIAGRFRVTLHEAALPATFLRRFPPDGQWHMKWSPGVVLADLRDVVPVLSKFGRYWQYVRAIAVEWYRSEWCTWREGGPEQLSKASNISNQSSYSGWHWFTCKMAIEMTV